MQPSNPYDPKSDKYEATKKNVTSMRTVVRHSDTVCMSSGIAIGGGTVVGIGCGGGIACRPGAASIYAAMAMMHPFGMQLWFA